MRECITLRYYEINEHPRDRNLRIKNIDTYGKAKRLEEIGCKFEVELLSTGLYHADIQFKGKQISNSVFEPKDSEEGFAYIFDTAYKKLIGKW